MRKALKFTAMLFGAVAFIAGTSSCNKEECCTVSGETICEEEFDSATYYGITWDDYKTLVEIAGGDCSKK